MPSILGDILAVKRREAAALAPRVADLRAAASDAPSPRGFARALHRRIGPPAAHPRCGAGEGQGVPGLAPPATAGSIRIIAEVKHRSPSAGVIIEPFDAAAIARRYAAAGADAISCLTDREFFGGSIDHLREVRAAAELPVLRKDFIIAPAQVYEARAAGADAVLLVAEALEQAEMTDLAALAADLGMDVLAEAHGEAALERAIACGAACVGVNNRDLATFKVDLATTERLAPAVLAAGRVLVAESGVKSAADVRCILAVGADAILVGEGLLRSGDVEAKLAELKQA
ncbi:MAG: indole-3-glycerol phosphate synthase TrpC [Planctomycetes bacterium]|nr:indole-3-glycerol phosphate synthase TrpC [Planctomycetota bacterium]